MTSTIPFILLFQCLLVPIYGILLIVLGRKVGSREIVYLVFAGIGTRFLYVVLNLIFTSSNNSFKLITLPSPIVTTVAVFLLIHIYSSVLIKALIRQSEIVSRFFLDSLPTQQLGTDLEYRQQAISIDSMRTQKAKLLSNSLQLGGLEGVLRWLVADIWIVLVGSGILAFSKFKGEAAELLRADVIMNIVKDFSANSLFLILCGILSAFPIIRFLSLGNMNGESTDLDVSARDKGFVVIAALVLSLVFMLDSSMSSYLGPIIVSALIIASYFYFFKKRSGTDVRQFLFLRKGDVFEVVPSLNDSEGKCTVEMPIWWSSQLNGSPLVYLEESGINLLPNVVTALEVNIGKSKYPKITFGPIELTDKDASASLYKPRMESRILKSLGAMAFFEKVKNSPEVGLAQNPTLGSLVKDFTLGFSVFYPSPIAVNAYLKYLVHTDQLRASFLSLVDVEKNENLAKILYVSDICGYSYVPIRILRYILEMVAEEREESEVLRLLVSELVKQCPHVIMGSDKACRVVSIDQEIAGHNHISLIEPISSMANDLKVRGLEPLVIKVEDIADYNLMPLLESLKNSGINFRVLDTSIKLSQNIYPLGII